jgi:LPXTG-motif cell wall-anchored protein
MSTGETNFLFVLVLLIVAAGALLVAYFRRGDALAGKRRRPF